MKRKTGTGVLATLIALIMLFGISADCDAYPAGDASEIHEPDNIRSGNSPADEIEIFEEMVPLSMSPMTLSVLMPAASGTNTMKNDKAEIDASNASDGYFMAKYLQKTSKTIKVLVTEPKGVQYQYSLNSSGSYEVYPFSDGNGKYQIGVFENAGGDRYATAYTTTVTVKLTNEFAPFIRPNQYVNYTASSSVVKKGAELTKKSTSDVEKIKAVYDFVVANIEYDTKLASSVKKGYIPDVDAVLKKGKGICFDYAAVMAAMLRSNGIPTKLVVGYAKGDIYHAWLNVYSKETGWIDSVIYFDGKSWKLMDPTFASTGNQSDEVMKFIGDGKNYSAKFIY